MNGMPNHNSLTAVAKESIAMSKETGDRSFQVMALVMMVVTGLATMLHAGHVLWRDMKPKRGREHEAAEPDRQPRKAEAGEEMRRQDEPEVSWVKKARISERPAEGEKVWAQQRACQDYAGRH
jgi:hypothetical protein